MNAPELNFCGYTYYDRDFKYTIQYVNHINIFNNPHNKPQSDLIYLTWEGAPIRHIPYAHSLTRLQAWKADSLRSVKQLIPVSSMWPIGPLVLIIARTLNRIPLTMFGSRFFKMYFLHIFFSRGHLLGTLFIFRLEKFLFRWCTTENFRLKVLNFLVLINRFSLNWNLS